MSTFITSSTEHIDDGIPAVEGGGRGGVEGGVNTRGQRGRMRTPAGAVLGGVEMSV